MTLLYITHPEVVIDPELPMPAWGLSELGRARARAFAARNVVPQGAPIFVSAERKTLELAGIISARSGGAVITDAAFNENDRSASGFITPPDRYDAVHTAFFAEPEKSAAGWERAADAQRRIVAAVHAAVEGIGDGPAVFCGHGAVGTLLKCHVAGREIAKSEDQRIMAWKGGGNCFAFSLDPLRLLFDWVAMEDFAGVPA